jgi:hypothetical protein
MRSAMPGAIDQRLQSRKALSDVADQLNGRTIVRVEIGGERVDMDDLSVVVLVPE